MVVNHPVPRLFALLGAMLALAFSLNAQTTTLSGQVTDAKGEPLGGANVYIKDSYDGATADSAGRYSFATTETGSRLLVASYVGYETLEQPVELTGGPMTTNLQMKEDFTTSNTVLITAGGFGANDQVKSIVLNPLDIVTTAGADGDIYGALQYLPGATAVGEENGIFVRGGSAAETVTIIDELVVQRPFFSSVPDIPSRGRFNPFLFKGTFFSTGGYSARYGQAMSSALVLNSQDLADTTFGGLSLLMVGGGGFYNKKWRKTSLAVSADYSDVALYFLLNKQRAQWELPPRNASGSIMFRHKPTQGGLIKAYVSYSRQHMVVKDFYPADSTGEQDTMRTKVLTDNFYSNISYRQLLNDNWVLFTGASLSWDEDNITLNSDSLAQRDLRGQAKFWLSRNLMKNSKLWVGAEGHRIDFDQRYNIYNTDTLDHYAASFAEAEIYFSPKVAFRAGVRGEYSSLVGEYNVAPRASFAVQVGKYGSFSLAYGQFYQNPARDYLIRQEGLRFELASHYIANFTWIKDKRTLRAEAYYKDYDNLVRFFPDTLAPPFYTAYDNSGYGHAAGFDVFWRDQKTLRNVDYWISYSYLDTKRLYQDFPVAATPYFASTHNASIVYKHFIAEIRTALGASYAFASGRPFRVPGDVNDAGNFMEDRTPPYHVLNVNASYLTTIKDNFTVIFFSLNNVLGRNNVFGYRYSPDGLYRQPVNPPQRRSFFIGMFISFM